MAKFIAKVFIFLAFLKICDILLSSFFFWYLQTKISVDEDYGGLNRMYHGEINTNLVFFGDSKPYLGINPEVIQQSTDQTAWNLSMDGSNFEQQEFTLEEYLLHNKLPKIVVFEADLFSLDPSFLRFKTELFLPYRNDSRHTFNLFNSSWDESLYYWFFSSTVYKPQIPAIFMDYKNIYRRIKDGGYVYEPLTKSKVLTTDKVDYIFVNGSQLKKGQLPGSPQTLPLPPPTRNIDLTKISGREQKFEGLAQFANDRGFALVLMFPPTLNGELDEGQRKIAVDFYTKLSQKYENIYFLDYSQDQQIDDNLDLWWDGDHLNIKGANILSEEVGQELNKILINNK